jgi:hypothetical protein
MARASRHTLSYCALCEGDMVICADCGNNCCNAGTKDIDGKPCGCDEAYEHQTMFWKDPSNITFAKDIRATVTRVLPDDWIKPPGGQSVPS